VQIYAGIAALVLGALVLIRWPLRVVGDSGFFRPTAMAPVRALVPGVVERVLVQEGDPVRRGTLLVSLRSTSLSTDRASMAAAANAADRSATLAASRADAAEERLQRIRGDALRQELLLLDEQLGYTKVRASVDGVVLTPHVNEKMGASLQEGDLLLTLGRTDTLELEFGVDQQDIGRVERGQVVHLRVDALPQRTFVGRVTSIGQLPTDSGPSVHYPVRASIENSSGLLRPHMSAYARVLTRPASAMDRLLRAPARWTRLLWWKIWG
jgi:RND family efflux transporter MFP subunit